MATSMLAKMAMALVMFSILSFSFLVTCSKAKTVEVSISGKDIIDSMPTSPLASSEEEDEQGGSESLGLGEDFDPKRVHFIDRVFNASISPSPNFLFRGNMPRATNNTYAYWPLVEALRTQARVEANITLPDDFYIIEISLLFVEYWDDDLSAQFYKQNPDKGKFLNWPLFGDVLGPDDFYPSIRKDMAETLNDWQIPDRLPIKMDLIHRLMYSKGPNGRPLLMYVHCEAGEDRTGEFSGSYYIKHLGWSYQKALDYDNHVESRHIMTVSKNALQWYCYYLYYVENQTQLVCSP